MQSLDLAVPIKFLFKTDNLFAALEDSHPFLIIMDYNLQPETGIEVLQKIRRHPAYQHIPVVILGDSYNTDFIVQCYRNGANTYATKPTTLEATTNKIRLFFKYWLEVAETQMPIN